MPRTARAAADSLAKVADPAFLLDSSERRRIVVFVHSLHAEAAELAVTAVLSALGFLARFRQQKLGRSSEADVVNLLRKAL